MSKYSMVYLVFILAKMTNCIVNNCPNKRSPELKRLGITFHMFPESKDMMKWVEAIRIHNGDANLEVTKTSRICSEHFEEKDKYFTKGGFRRLRDKSFPVFWPDLTLSQSRQRNAIWRAPIDPLVFTKTSRSNHQPPSLWLQTPITLIDTPSIHGPQGNGKLKSGENEIMIKSENAEEKVLMKCETRLTSGEVEVPIKAECHPEFEESTMKSIPQSELMQTSEETEIPLISLSQFRSTLNNRDISIETESPQVIELREELEIVYNKRKQALYKVTLLQQQNKRLKKKNLTFKSIMIEMREKLSACKCNASKG